MLDAWGYACIELNNIEKCMDGVSFVHTRAHICAHKFWAAVSAVADIIWDGLGLLAFSYT